MSLTYKDLISDIVKEQALSLLNNDSESISFYISNNIEESIIDRYYSSSQGWHQIKNAIQIGNIGHSFKEFEFIRTIFNDLDKILDIDFSEFSNNNGSKIDIYSVNLSSTFTNSVIGQAIYQESKYGAWFDILWKDSDNKKSFNNNDKNTIIHEIGHSLGLSHPSNDPYNLKWNTDDTVMSYNISNTGKGDWFSKTDLDALINIWGRENDTGRITLENKFENYDFSKETNNQYFLETSINRENITNLNEIEFSDQILNVNDDIKNIFKQLTEIDSLTGKIFRLYNASFDRFPDRDGFKYWVDINTSGENTYRQTCASFILSNEFKSKYGDLIDNEDYLNALYLNIFTRTPDTDGLNYWLGQLNNGFENREEVLMGFSESIENKNIFAEKIGLI
tara:strand:+ start:2439 stop:3617 length:1179 start_codon:yes stop_codon:yes gene_type:complete